MRTRVLYVGPLDPAGTCFSRMKGLMECGVEVVPWDKSAHLRLDDLPRSRSLVASTFGVGERHRRAQNQLLRDVDTYKPHFVWIDKADWLRIETLRKLRASGAKLVQHTTDALFPRQLGLYVTRTLIRRSVGEFDVFLTTNRRDAAKLSRRHAHVLVTQLGYDDDRFVPSANPVQDPETDCVFIGHYEPRTERYTRALAQSGLRLRVHGDAAWRTTKTAACIHAELRPPVWNSEYVEAIRSAKVALCFLSQWNYNESTARTFEIPATGTAMLAMRTAEHAAFFNEGTEALLFSNEHECIEKAKYLCANAEARCAMAQAGRARCIASGYSWKRIMERDWSRLQQRDRGLRAGPSS